MANIEKHNGTNSHEEDSFDNLAYRYDLEDAIGIIILPPASVLDEAGMLQGDSDDPNSPASRYLGEIRQNVENIMENAAAEYLPDTPLDRRLPSHLYAQPPAAQGTNEIAFWLWENGPSILMTLDAAINVGKVIQAASNRIRRMSFSTDQDTDVTQRSPHGPEESIRTYWSQTSVMTVVVADAASRYGISDESIVRVFPRGNEYLGGPEHPNPHISYLVRIDDGPRTLIYCVLADGNVVEHFQLAGDRITPLELPHLIEQADTMVTTFPSQRFQFRAEPNRT